MSRVFHPGQTVKSSGIYRAIHGEGNHYHDHEVTILSGAQFPFCVKCGDAVRFARVHLARHVDKHVEFNPSASQADTEASEVFARNENAHAQAEAHEVHRA